MLFGKLLKEKTDKGRVLVLSPFEQNVRRLTTDTSKRRNQFVGALAAAVFAAYARTVGPVWKREGRGSKKAGV